MPVKRLTYQFSNVSQVLTAATSPFPPIRALAEAVEIEIFPPVAENAHVQFTKALPRQPISVSVGLMTVRVQLEDHAPDPEWRTLYEFIRQCVSWIRAATRQFWLGMMPSQQTNSPVALLLSEIDGQEAHVTGLGAIRAGVNWVPLFRETWDAIGKALQNGWWPLVSEQFLLDSSLHLAQGNYPQAIAGMGIACEVELNGFLQDLIEKSGQQPLVTELYKRSRAKFRWNLEHLPGLLGASSFASGTPDRVSAVVEMYESRGKVVHGGNISTGGEKIARYWFAAEDLFAWTRNERIRLGIGPDLSDIYRSLEQGRSRFSFVFRN
jgi:hypothetical protein